MLRRGAGYDLLQGMANGQYHCHLYAGIGLGERDDDYLDQDG